MKKLILVLLVSSLALLFVPARAVVTPTSAEVEIYKYGTGELIPCGSTIHGKAIYVNSYIYAPLDYNSRVRVNFEIQDSDGVFNFIWYSIRQTITPVKTHRADYTRWNVPFDGHFQARMIDLLSGLTASCDFILDRT